MPKTFSHFELELESSKRRVGEREIQLRAAERRARAIAEGQRGDAVLVYRVWPGWRRVLMFRAAFNASAGRVLGCEVWHEAKLSN